MKKTLPIGLRTIKTALSVTLAVLLVRMYSSNTDAIFYAAMGAAVGMDITVSGSVRQGITQLIGVICGTLMGVLSLWLFPEMPAFAVGAGVLLLILLSNALRINFSISLSCIIFLSAALTASPEDRLWYDAALRMCNTTVGILIALLINGAIRPYNNRTRIIQLLHRCQKRIIAALECAVLLEQNPTMEDISALLRQLDAELRLYHAQRLFRRKKQDEALLQGCRQLCERMLQELEVINGMDSRGDLLPEQAARMAALGLPAPVGGISGRRCDAQDTVVMNYHIDKLLTANQYLNELLTEP